MLSTPSPSRDATADRSHYPLTFFIGELFGGASDGALQNTIYLVAMVKIVISFTWMIVLARNTTMGVAWHRFTAWPNIWFKRNADGRTALGGLQPMMAGGVPIDFENIEDLDEDTAFGVGKVEDFTWKGLLDFTSCTECGRCQSQCPAWNTEKPLSPKLLVMALREHAYAKAPYLLAAETGRAGLGDDAARGGRPAAHRQRRRRTASSTPTCCGRARRAARASSSARSTSSTSTTSWTCGATRCWSSRTSRPSSTSSSRASRTRATRGTWRRTPAWTGPRACRSRSSRSAPTSRASDEVEWLFWVGCAGAYEDRAKKTTRAVAELLHEAGVVRRTR